MKERAEEEERMIGERKIPQILRSFLTLFFMLCITAYTVLHSFFSFGDSWGLGKVTSASVFIIWDEKAGLAGVAGQEVPGSHILYPGAYPRVGAETRETGGTVGKLFYSWMKMRRTGGVVDIHFRRFNMIGGMVMERDVRDGQVRVMIHDTRWDLRTTSAREGQVNSGGTVRSTLSGLIRRIRKKDQSDGSHCSVGYVEVGYNQTYIPLHERIRRQRPPSRTTSPLPRPP
ncbi:hypothetical protein QBC32DRAFT_41158 [Pseudoneurospora amorphoporcata]|uniref:Uncharacterized protein n=1 Tax=Pseudoneurospora amorphoporcata TaxID=241081 RepID=A0AAN6NQI6_9PEZI|nr:hypothetical protein QBC32DRAFT_41158 [Pseudoneurospora amorphoporcata]